jgi:signal transduction histidine kinase
MRADGTDVLTLVTGRYQRDGDGSLLGLVLVLRRASTRAHQAATGIEFVSTVSHELRSPLTSVKGYTSLLLSRWERLKDDQKKMFLEQVNHDADRVTRLIEELLDISRLETGRLMLRRQMVDMAPLAATVLEKVGMEYADLEARTSFPPDFPRVYADPDKVAQVLTNLVENACKYASPKGMSVVGEVREGDVSVTVTDAGEGIPEADLPKVFTKFFRRDMGRPTGSGLGLWISRGLVEAHGGRLSASSTPGRGTAFRFTLPLVDFDDVHP